MAKKITVLQTLPDFFDIYLLQTKGLSENTITSYKYTFQLLYEYLYSERGLKPNKVMFSDLENGTIENFLIWLEDERKCSISTRNQRKAAISSFAKYSLRNFFTQSYAKGEGFSYVFSKHYGVFTSIIIGGEEQLAGMMKLSAFRAPTDNDRNVMNRWANVNIWQGENLNCQFSKVYDCRIEDGAIIVDGSLAGVSRVPFFRYTQKITVSKQGKINFELRGNIREDAFFLPRIGFEMELPESNNKFTYYGSGPFESYCDMCHASSVGMYESSAENEYVNYVRPQEHGNHNKTKMLKIGNLKFENNDEFESNVSKYSTAMLYKAEHADELKTDGKVHLRIDYKVSGLGSNSCGPALNPRYQVNDKNINFCFSLG